MLHDGYVGWRLADGHIAVISHGNEDSVFWSSQEVFLKKLSQAAPPGDGCPLIQQVNSNFWGSARGEGGTYDSQVSEKEVHGSWKCGAEGNDNDNEQIFEQVNQENGQKDNEEYFPQVWILCESQENKFSHIVGRCGDIHSPKEHLPETRIIYKGMKNDTF